MKHRTLPSVQFVLAQRQNELTKECEVLEPVLLSSFRPVIARSLSLADETPWKDDTYL